MSSYQFNLKQIDNTTSSIYKDVSCDILVINGVTVNKTRYDKLEYLVTKQFTRDAANEVSLNAGTTINATNLLLSKNAFSSLPFATMKVNSVMSTPNNGTLFSLDSSITQLPIGNNTLVVKPSDQAVAVNKNWFNDTSIYSLDINGTLYNKGFTCNLPSDNSVKWFVSSTSSASPPEWIRALAASCPTGGSVDCYIGKNSSNYNCARMRFNYSGGTGSTSNYMSVGMPGGATLAIDGTGAVVVNGKLSCTNQLLYPFVVQTSPAVMALKFVGLTVAGIVKFNTIATENDRGTVSSSGTFVNSDLEISFNTTSGLFTCTSTTTKRYMIFYQITASNAIGTPYSVQAQIRFGANSATPCDKICLDNPTEGVTGVGTGVSSSCMYIGSSTKNSTFDMFTSSLNGNTGQSSNWPIQDINANNLSRQCITIIEL